MCGHIVHIVCHFFTVELLFEDLASRCDEKFIADITGIYCRGGVPSTWFSIHVGHGGLVPPYFWEQGTGDTISSAQSSETTETNRPFTTI